MRSLAKLKWNNARILAFAGFGYLITLIVESQLFGTEYATWIWGVIYVIWDFAQTLRTRIYYFSVLGLLCGLGAWHYQIAATADTILTMPTFIMHLVIILASLLLWGIKVMSRQAELEANARRIFELAAGQIEDTANGFTERPFVAGKVEHTWEDILAFVRFLDGSHIAKLRVESDIVRLLFSLSVSPLSNPQLDKISHISFDSNSNMIVQISKSDYRKYKEQLTFDQLCAALANMFKRFLQYSCEGREQRIISELGT